MTLLVRKTFCIYFFPLGFSVEFALFDSINKVDFVNIILYVKCPLWMECMSVFFSGVTEINFGQNKIRQLLKIQGIIIGNSVSILTKTIVRKKK